MNNSRALAMSPDQIVAKIARGKGSGTVPTLCEGSITKRKNKLPKREKDASTVTPELLFAPFFVPSHVRPGLTAHWVSVPWVHRHQGSNRTEEAQVYPAERPSPSHMVRLELQHSSRGPVQPMQRVAPRHSEAQWPRVGVTIRTL
jgi:hypothetical protein